MTDLQRICHLTAEVDRLTVGIDRALDLRARWDAEHTDRGAEHYPRAAGYYGAMLDGLVGLVGDDHYDEAEAYEPTAKEEAFADLQAELAAEARHEEWRR